MATSVSGDFEAALGRLEEIVQKLERDNVGLDESVTLFREGKGLAQKCERLLKEAQASIDAATRGDGEDEPSARVGNGAPLFAGSLVDDDPEL
jgi:exodeoxyribonuclease VII small subunit